MTQPFAGIISRVVAQEKARRGLGPRVNVFIEDRFSFALAAELAYRHGLRPGLEVTPDLLSTLLSEDGDAHAYQTALNFLGMRPRSTREIRQRLQKDEWPETVIDRVIERLENAKLLDDAAFAEVWVRGRTGSRARGGRALTQELRQKGVDPELISEALPEPDEELANALVALAPCLRKLAGKEERVRRQKATEFLMRRGFSYGTAKTAVAHAQTEEN